MSFETRSLKLLKPLLALMGEKMADMPDFTPEVDLHALEPVLKEVAVRMQDNYPYNHPLYAGQMLKPPHPVARLAYMLALWVNPNNHALDGGRASSAMEKEAVQNLARMFGFDGPVLGHLSSGGTFANLEALWVAGQLAPGKTVLASAQAHYTHGRICSVLGIPFEAIGIDADARMDLDALERRLKGGDVACVVATLGTTGLGSVDDLTAILTLCETYSCRVHVDAAYGGYFVLASGLAAQDEAAFRAIGQADSVVVDPHKHGLQPYGCGSVLFSDPDVGRFYKHGSPYTYFSSSELHLGEISLECSRAGASAVALWATQKLLPMVPDGEFAQGLSNSHLAALDLYGRIQTDEQQLAFLKPSLDIVCWAPRAQSSSEISRLSEALFHGAAEQDLHLATMTLDSDWLQPKLAGVTFDTAEVTVLRSCLMKAEHVDWVDEIWSRYKTAQALISR